MSRNRNLVCFFAVALAYAGPYLYYRIARPEASLGYVGGHVIRPSWFPGNGSDRADFTFSSYSRRFGSLTIGESFAGDSLVTELSEASGYDMAEGANTVYYPAAWMDHLFTGRYIRFPRFAARPIFSSRAPTPEAVEIDPSQGAVESPN